MKFRQIVLSSAFALGAVSAANAADISAGKATASAVCAACHGANGISVRGNIPNLAGQKEQYLVGQLKAFKSGKRKNAMMNAIAKQVDNDAIANVAAFFASLPGAAKSTEKSKPLANLVANRITFPKDFDSGYTHYTTINFANRKQVRKYYANAAALKAARDGTRMPNGSVLVVEVYKTKLGADKKPMMGSDGFFVADKLVAYTAMEKQAGWGKDFPELLRNGDWQYAVFKGDRTRRPGVNQATCLACHKPHVDKSYVFSLEALQKVARK